MKPLMIITLGWFYLMPLLLGMGTLVAAPEPGRTYHLLVIDSQSGAPYGDIREAMLEQLFQSGYRLGENLRLSAHTIGNELSSGTELVKAAMESPPDVIFAGGTVATIAARNVLFEQQQPVVFAGTTDPVGIGVIDAFDQPPKANFTGVSYPVPVEARFRFIRHLLPQAKRIGLIYADMPQSRSYNRWIRELIDREELFRDMQVVFTPVTLATGNQGDIQMAEQAAPLVRALDKEVDLFISPNDQFGAREEFARLIDTESDKPLIGLVRDDVMAGWGALATVYPLHDNIGVLAARMVQDIFEGKPVQEITPRRPSRFGYAVNLGRAQGLGVKVPVGILQLAGKNILK